ncbi:MAG: hypothetical protein CSA66_02340 [Proteobacteria bacterium]|nr:MAG: hypothetical protein CSA66_02340 [Pseudomonadota bacterium]
MGSPNEELGTVNPLGLSVLGWSTRRRAFRVVASVTAGLFFGLGLLASAPLPWASGPAWAAPGKVAQRAALFVVSKRNSVAGEAKVLQSLMRDELGKLAGIVAVGAYGDSATPIGQTVGPDVEAGFRALNERDGAAAEAAFRKAYDQLSAYRGPFDKRLMARTLKGLAVASVLTGRLPAAEQMVNAALNLWPDQQAAEYGWTLDARTAFRDVERKRIEQPLGSVELTSEPSGAEIRVGGDLKGFTPLTVQGLGPGAHWFEATLDGYARGGTFVDVMPGQGGIAHIDLDPLRDKGAIEAALRNVQRLIRSTKSAGPLANLQRLTAAHYVIVLQVDKRRGNYQFDGWVRSGSEAPERLNVTFAEDANLVTNLQGLLSTTLQAEVAPGDDVFVLDGPPQASVMDGDSLYIDPNDPIFKEDKRHGSDPITEQWWFWAIAGTAAAALVVGGVYLFSSDDEGSGPAGNVLINLNRLQ